MPRRALAVNDPQSPSNQKALHDDRMLIKDAACHWQLYEVSSSVYAVERQSERPGRSFRLVV